MRIPSAGQTEKVAESAGRRDIMLHAFGTGELSLLLLGGVHGDESEGFLFAERLLERLRAGDMAPPPGTRLYICPRLNPDGCEALRRTNDHNVDLNRNLPTKDWTGDFKNVRYYPGRSAGSEPESTATLELIQETKAAAVFSLHSYENAMINFNGDCENLADAMSVHNKLPPKGDIGYPTPGSLGTWSGWERNIPTITLEILRGQEPEAVWDIQRDAMMAGFEFYTKHPLPARK